MLITKILLVSDTWPPVVTQCPATVKYLSYITYEVYQEERKIINIGKRKHHDDALLPNKKQKSLKGK